MDGTVTTQLCGLFLWDMILLNANGVEGYAITIAIAIAIAMPVGIGNFVLLFLI